VSYHAHNLGELYDLENDPWEFNNLWGAPESRDLKYTLLEASFNTTMMQSLDVGPRRIAPM
jgi:hypothetical protein